jgi:D-tagatose-1,6-bisphosphate aldolase subunit GatZ/KbaZ
MITTGETMSVQELRNRLENNKKGLPQGIYSVCSAHRAVLEAAMLQAREDRSFVVIESTSNQVDQYGGYMNMTPVGFTVFVRNIACEIGFPDQSIIFGGDHLGPNSWQRENAGSAMEKAKTLVHSYVEAGYQKIHLDASMFCADDGGDRKKPLADEIVAERVVELCEVCERAWKPAVSGQKPLYIIGTEVPVPGGAREQEAVIHPTSKESIAATIEITKKKFMGRGLEDAWQRVIAVVAQPGVEFGDSSVFHYDRKRAEQLSRALDNEPMVFEAHSTDYQTKSGLKKLVEDHFAILKVGPWLTYLYREALFALAAMEKELAFKFERLSALEETLEKTMLNAAPNYWEKYYRGSGEEQRFSRKYSFSDRSRYYWTNPELSESVSLLLENMSSAEIPLSLVSQFMPNLFPRVTEGSLPNIPGDLITAHIREKLAWYAQAAGTA